MNLMGIETANLKKFNKFTPQAMPHKVINNIAGASPVNVGKYERYASIALGAFLLYRSVKNRRWGSLLFGSTALGLLNRGVSGYCPMYGKAKLSSSQG